MGERCRSSRAQELPGGGEDRLAAACDARLHDVPRIAAHPGIVSTDLVDDVVPAALIPFRALIHRRLLTPGQGATAAFGLATDPRLAGTTGRYYVRDEEQRSPDISYDPATRATAWRPSLAWTLS